MKAALFLCVAGALAAAPPTIELNLGQRTYRATNGGVQTGDAHEVSDWSPQDHAVQHRPNNDYQRGQGVTGNAIEQRQSQTQHVHVIQLDQPIWREHNENLVQPGGAPVKSRQDITIRCAVCESNCDSYENTCKLPMARAYDHVGANGEQDRREVPVRKSLWRVDYQKQSDLDAGSSQSTTQEKEETAIDWTRRSTYLIKYDATDYAGNHAEQVVVAVILDDLNPPTITMCNGSSERVEAGNGWHLCATTTAFDQVDGDVTSRIRVSVERQQGNSWVETEWTKNCKNSDSNGCTQVWKVKPEHVNGDADHDDPLTSEPLSDRQPGTFRVRYFCDDKAGIYGTDYRNNFITVEKIVTIEDDTPPVIEVQGVSPYTLECTHTYVDTGAEVSDQLDSLNFGVLNYNAVGPADCTAGGDCKCNNAAECNNWENGVNIQPQTVPQTYTITYNAEDSNGNKAVTQTRQVYVRDTTAPIVALNADDATPHAANQGKKSPLVYRTNSAHSPSKIQAHSPNEDSWTNHFDPGATCSDSCDRTVTDSTITMSWGSKPFVDNVLGKYVRTYTCCDRSNNCASVEREFIVEDKEVPEITVTGTNPLYLEAQHNKDYADAGATCSDYVDNQLDSAVRASGDLVQMAVPGEYVIKYDCTDLSGNNAVQQKRTVIVQDTTCPQIKVNGAVINYLESGFPFVDELPAGFATAYDTLDGDITHKITSNGDSVTTASTFYQRRSCRDIKHFYPEAHTSEYYITRLVRNGHYERVLVWCDMAPAQAATYYLVSNGKHVTNPYNGNAATNEASSCPDHGLKLMTIDFTQNWENTAWYTRISAQFPRWTAGGVTGSTNKYLCVEDKSGQDGKDSEEQRRRHALTNAQMGKYVIQYTVEDAHGNRNDCDDNQPGRDCNQACSDLSSGKCTAKALCDAGQQDYCLPCSAANARRTVIVKDDLPTVTKLSDRTALGLMAETRASSADAWLVGAAAAAVAGVALLAMARGKETVTSVPV